MAVTALHDLRGAYASPIVHGFSARHRQRRSRWRSVGRPSRTSGDRAVRPDRLPGRAVPSARPEALRLLRRCAPLPGRGRRRPVASRGQRQRPDADCAQRLGRRSVFVSAKEVCGMSSSPWMDSIRHRDPLDQEGNSRSVSTRWDLLRLCAGSGTMSVGPQTARVLMRSGLGSRPSSCGRSSLSDTDVDAGGRNRFPNPRMDSPHARCRPGRSNTSSRQQEETE